MSRELPDSAKFSHASVYYVENAQHAESRADCDDECSNCINFIACDRNSRCNHVQSPINPGGWCVKYQENPNASEV